jgi:hypothetical protein
MAKMRPPAVLLLVLIGAIGACGSSSSSKSKGTKRSKKSERLSERVKQQEKGLAEERNTDKHTKSEKIPPPTRSELKEFKRIWAHFAKGDARWPLERDRFKSRSTASGYMLATYLISYYMQLNIVRDRAPLKIVAVKNEIVAVGRPCTPFLVDMMILDTLTITLDKKKRKMRVDDLTRQDCKDMLERMGSVATPQLLRALKRKDLGMKARRMIGQTLGGTGDKRAMKPLVTMLRKDESWQVRADAAMALGRLGDKRAIAALTEAVKRDTDRFVVRKAGESRYKLRAGRRG